MSLQAAGGRGSSSSLYALVPHCYEMNDQKCSYSSNVHLSQSLQTGRHIQPSWVIWAGSEGTCQGQLDHGLTERLDKGEICFQACSRLAELVS